MKKTNTFQETAETGRVVIDLGDGTTLDTNTLGATVTEVEPGVYEIGGTA